MQEPQSIFVSLKGQAEARRQQEAHRLHDTGAGLQVTFKGCSILPVLLLSF